MDPMNDDDFLDKNRGFLRALVIGALVSVALWTAAIWWLIA